MNNRIKAIREKYNLNRNQFARTIGISPSAIQYIEIGKTKPSIDTIKKICEIYDESADWIISGKLQNETKEKINMNIGERIRAERKKKGLTQKELGELIGRSAAQITKIESNQADMPLSLFIKICNILHISPNYLITGEKIPSENIFDNLNISEIEIVNFIIGNANNRENNIKNHLKDQSYDIIE